MDGRRRRRHLRHGGSPRAAADFHILYAVADRRPGRDFQPPIRRRRRLPCGLLLWSERTQAARAPRWFLSDNLAADGQQRSLRRFCRLGAGSGRRFPLLPVVLECLPIPGAVDPTYLPARGRAGPRPLHPPGHQPVRRGDQQRGDFGRHRAARTWATWSISPRRSSIGTATSQLINGFVLGAATSGSESADPRLGLASFPSASTVPFPTPNCNSTVQAARSRPTTAGPSAAWPTPPRTRYSAPLPGATHPAATRC